VVKARSCLVGANEMVTKSRQVHAHIHHHHRDIDTDRPSQMLGPLQVPRQQQAQGQQQQAQQQQQPQQQQQQQLQQQGDLLPPPQSGQDFTLSSVLHFLQTEWRRYERDRNEWEIERAEMRVCPRPTTWP
jgi:deoxyribodipyrimidine photolyase